MAQGRIRKGIEESITAGVSAGEIDRKKHAAALAMVRKMADALDGEPDATVAFKTITPKMYLDYLDALGMVPNSKNSPKQADRPRKQAKLTAFAGGAKFSKVANG